MRMTMYTDFSLRLLIYLAIRPTGEKATVPEIADSYGISKHHLMKVAQHLAKLGYIESTRGRGGGVRLLKEPDFINVGQVVRQMEDDFYLVECFDREKNGCPITPVCSLKHALGRALQAYLAVLDDYTLQDLAHNPLELLTFLNGNQQPT